jgi:uncharacterized protein YceH (UPF0502 family)
MHTAGGAVEEAAAVESPAEAGAPLSVRVARLEAQVEEIAEQLRALVEKLGG